MASLEEAFGQTFSLEQAFGESGGVGKNPDDEIRLSIAQRFGKDLFHRQKVAEEIMQATADGEQSYAEGLGQLVGKVGAGGVLDLLGELLVSGGRTLSDITPDAIETPIKNTASSAAHWFLDTDAGQAGLNAAKSGMESWEKFKTNHPRAARNIEAVVNVGLLAAPAKSKKSSGDTLFKRKGDDLYKRAQAQSAANRRDFIDELITPRDTLKNLEGRALRTTEGGPLKSRQYTLSPMERNVAKEVNKIREVTPANTALGNLNVIQRELKREEVRLVNRLKSNDFKVSRDNFFNHLEGLKNNLNKNMVLRGDPTKTADAVVDSAKELLPDKNVFTGSDILRMRKDLDNLARKNVGERALNPANPTENAMSIALREVRQGVNNFVDSGAKNVGVRNSLRKQNHLHIAKDNIVPKAAREAENAALRLWQRATSILPFRGEFNQSMAALFGIGGLGASAQFAPWFTKVVGLGLGIHYTGKMVMSTRAKRGLSELLKKTDSAIRNAKDSNLIREMRADRAMVVELLQNSEVED